MSSTPITFSLHVTSALGGVVVVTVVTVVEVAVVVVDVLVVVVAVVVVVVVVVVAQINSSVPCDVMALLKRAISASQFAEAN